MAEKSIAELQEALIAELRKNGTLKTDRVAEAFRAVPRHLFVPNEPLENVYSDVVIRVKQNESGEWTSASSQPAIMAIMLEQLDLQPGQRVLEIGAGTGFNAALMAAIVGPEGQVTSVDIQPDLIEAARAHLEAAGYDWVQAVAGDGGYGYPPNAPYDRIILTVSAGVIAPAWREQLVEGGRLVLPFNLGGPMLSVAFERKGSELVSISSAGCGFMPLQGAFSEAQPVKTQLGPDPNRFLMSLKPPAMGADLLSAWLDETMSAGFARPDLSSGVFVGKDDPWQMQTWLTIQQLDWGTLIAEGELVEQHAIPALVRFGRNKDYRAAFTFMLLGKESAAVLTRPLGQMAPYTDEAPESAPPGPFELYVRALGPDDSAAQRLLEIIRDWDRAGKPDNNRLHLRVLPAEMEYALEPGEIILERPWTKLVVSYAPAAPATG